MWTEEIVRREFAYRIALKRQLAEVTNGWNGRGMVSTAVIVRRLMRKVENDKGDKSFNRMMLAFRLLMRDDLGITDVPFKKYRLGDYNG